MANRPWQTLTTKYVLRNPWYKVRQDQIIRPNGEEGVFNVIECGKSVFIIALNDKNKMLLVKLFRYPTQDEGWEIPAGGVDEGEDPLTAAKRELQEETGLIASKWRGVGSFDSFNGIADAEAYVFVASELKPDGEHMQQEEGITETKAFTAKETMTMIRKGQIVDGVTIAALMKTFVAIDAVTIKSI